MDVSGDIGAVISKQHQELMAASACESDLDFAFRLQLEEAIASSMLNVPSSSSSPPTVVLPPEPEDDAVAVSLRLQALEIERFQQELSDSAQSRNEMLRVSRALRIRAHDEKFAREITEMSDGEWEETGDEFEKPVGKVEEDGDPFKVYVKGLISEEVPGLAVLVVAVVDSVGNLVMKVQKPVVGGRFSREVVEAMTLIEGLNAVVSLGIRRVDVFVDYMVLYNHITRRWIVKQRKVAKLIEQAWSLQSKLQRCSYGLLPRRVMPYVFKLARYVIESQMKKDKEQKGKSRLNEQCDICLEENDNSKMYSIEVCMHRFCFSCMRQHVEVKLLHGILPTCPHDGCKTKLNVESSKSFLPPKLVSIMTQRMKEASIPSGEKVYCPYPKCSALMSRNEAIQLDQSPSSQQPRVRYLGQRKCIKCNGIFCINCKVPWERHAKMSCQEYKRLNPNPNPEEEKLRNLARRSRWRQCAKCDQMIELAEGCYHMTCRCGYEFCYTCGAPWENKKATCACPLWDEEYILNDDNDMYGDSDDDDEEEEEDNEDDEYYDSGFYDDYYAF